MIINKQNVISSAEAQLNTLKNRVNEYQENIDTAEKIIREKDERGINDMVESYQKRHSEDTSSTDKLNIANRYIKELKYQKQVEQEEAEEIENLVAQLKKDDEILNLKLELLNDKLEICRIGGYNVEVCKRLQDLIKTFLLDNDNSCTKLFDPCKKMLNN